MNRKIDLAHYLITICIIIIASCDKNKQFPKSDTEAFKVDSQTSNYVDTGNFTTIDTGSITYIDLSNKQLTDIPNLSRFRQLRTIDLSNNRLSTVNIHDIPQTVTYLDVSRNNIEIIELSKNCNLEHLDCSNNKLIGIELCQENALKFLDVSYNRDFNGMVLFNISKIDTLKYDHIYGRRIFSLETIRDTFGF